VVVLEQEDRSRVTGRSLHRSVGQAGVGHAIAGAPRVEQLLVDVRGVGARVHLVLHEPQERVGERAVVPVVDLVGQVDELEAEILAREVLLEQRPGARRLGSVATGVQEAPCGTVPIGHCGCDPRERRVTPELGERGDEAARSARGRQPPRRVVVVPERDRAPVRHDHEAAVPAEQLPQELRALICHAVKDARRGQIRPTAWGKGGSVRGRRNGGRPGRAPDLSRSPPRPPPRCRGAAPG
jgi:hypothetical protein